VKVEGVVTWQVPGKLLYIQDAKDGMRVETSAPDLVPAGTKVEVVGFPAMGEYSPVLKYGVFRAIGKTAEIAPLRVEAKDVLLQGDFPTVSYDTQLVQIEGRVIQSRTEGSQRVLMLRAGDVVFGAREELPPSEAIGAAQEGSVVRLTGICSIVTDGDRNPTSFSIVLRSKRDIVQLKSPPWWDPAHAVTLFLILGATMMMIALWVIVLRSRVERQTRIIRDSETRYRHLAEHDVLTGLLNRSTLEQRLVAALTDSQRERLNAAVFTIDIDHFKQINDAHGHLIGDEVLQGVGRKLASAVRAADTVARTGGEEFTIVAASLDGDNGATRIGATILQAFREPVQLVGKEIAVTVSVGCALFPRDGKNGDELRKRSDQALYEAKRTGRNRIVIASQVEGLGSRAASVSNPSWRLLQQTPNQA
jgi:diguanylate cyclase (GGDEF)-like protein